MQNTAHTQCSNSVKSWSKNSEFVGVGALSTTFLLVGNQRSFIFNKNNSAYNYFWEAKYLITRKCNLESIPWSGWDCFSEHKTYNLRHLVLYLIPCNCSVLSYRSDVMKHPHIQCISIYCWLLLSELESHHQSHDLMEEHPNQNLIWGEKYIEICFITLW